MADLVDRVKKVFKIHVGKPVPTDRLIQTLYEENLTAAFLDALDNKISEFIETHCIGWCTASLAVIASYANHAEGEEEEEERRAQEKGRKKESQR